MKRVLLFIAIAITIVSCSKDSVNSHNQNFRIKSLKIRGSQFSNNYYFTYDSQNRVVAISIFEDTATSIGSDLRFCYLPNRIDVKMLSFESWEAHLNQQGLPVKVYEDHHEDYQFDITYDGNNRVKSVYKKGGFVPPFYTRELNYFYNNDQLDRTESIADNGDTTIHNVNYTNGYLTDYKNFHFDYVNGKLARWEFKTSAFERIITFQYDPASKRLTSMEDGTVWGSNPALNSPDKTITIEYEELPGVFPFTWKSQVYKEIGLPTEILVLNDYHGYPIAPQIY